MTETEQARFECYAVLDVLEEASLRGPGSYSSTFTND